MTTLGPGRALRITLFAFAVRLLVVAFAAGRFPPADDATFYQVIAERIARGLGYTWAWPDGTVTFAANYPVGYPALLAVFYRFAGPHVAVGMLVNAVLGALATLATVALASRSASPRGAAFAGLVVAVEPALVLYTPALMTEAVAGELLVVAAAIATSSRAGLPLRALLAGLVLGGATLIRPELLLLAPFCGALLVFRAARPAWTLAGALTVTLVALLICAPWTLRNCARLDRCAFVSANAGQNLLIGTSSLGRGGWVSFERMGVPSECRNIFGEGGKDRCFGRAALAAIARDPGAWLALAPAKLAATFDHGTAAAHYLSASNPLLVGARPKTVVGALELLGQRVMLALAALALARGPGPRPRARRWLSRGCVALCLVPSAWLGFLVFLLEGVLLGRTLVRLPPALLAVAVVGATALTHVLFFGAGRYALVCLPALGALSGLLWPERQD